MAEIFPSILPDNEQVDTSDVREMLNDDHKLIQQAAVVVKEFSGSEPPINGQSNKTEILSYLSANYNERDIETIRDKAAENLEAKSND